MISLFQDSVFFGVLISLAAYAIGLLLKIKTGWSLMNPLLISIILVICTLLITGVDYKTYNAGANIISYLLTPATICLAVPRGHAGGYNLMTPEEENFLETKQTLTAEITSFLAGRIAEEELPCCAHWYLVGSLGKSLLCTSSGFGVPLRPCSLCYILAKIHHHSHRYWCF